MLKWDIGSWLMDINEHISRYQEFWFAQGSRNTQTNVCLFEALVVVVRLKPKTLFYQLNKSAANYFLHSVYIETLSYKQ